MEKSIRTGTIAMNEAVPRRLQSTSQCSPRKRYSSTVYGRTVEVRVMAIMNSFQERKKAKIAAAAEAFRGSVCTTNATDSTAAARAITARPL